MKVKTAVLRAAGKAEVIDRELPELASHEVLVKVAADNICTSEYGAFNGSRNRPTPLVFGHEWAGTVEAVGSEVSSVAVGDYVASGYYYDPYTLPSREGTHERVAVRARTSECPHLMSADHPNDDGFFGNAGCAEYVVSSEVACYKIDDGIDPSVAALLEPLGTCCAGFRRFGCDFGDTVVVIGAGTMGILNALVAKAHGCRVLITEMMPKKLEAARRLGLEAIDVSAVDPVEKVKELTGGRGADGVIVAVAAASAYAQAIDMLKEKRGRLLIFAAGYPGAEVGARSEHRALPPHGDRGHLRRRLRRLQEAANLINMRAANFEELVEEKIPLDQIQHAFERACEPGMFRISVICNEGVAHALQDHEEVRGGYLGNHGGYLGNRRGELPRRELWRGR